MVSECVPLVVLLGEECAKCEEKVGEEVCGSNGKTYNSLCHAISCGGLKQMDVTFGSCENKNPCSHHHCSSSEVCAAMTYGPCLSVYATDGRRLPCRQYICGEWTTSQYDTFASMRDLVSLCSGQGGL